MDPETAIKKGENPPDPVYLQAGEIQNTLASDAVFGEINEDGPNYRNV